MSQYRLWLLALFLVLQSDIFASELDLQAISCKEGIYGVGAGQRDITGPIAESIMMGYAELTQKAKGLHTRLRSRAFVFYDPCAEKFSALVVADLAMIFGSVKEGVLKYLEREAPHTFSHENLLLTATHTHNGPGGYAFYPLYNLSTLGFNAQNYQTIVRGIAESILTAFRSMVAGRISYARGDLEGINFNRSMTAYENNPDEEISSYAQSTNNTMHLVKFESLGGALLGSINWFAVHPVSLTLKNDLVSGDNKGLAAYYLEKRMGVTYQQNNEFVGAFAQADAGDVSPYDVTHPPKNSDEEFLMLEESALRQADSAFNLLHEPSMPIKGPIDVRHQFVDMAQFVVSADFTGLSDEPLCSAALGRSFAAGTENGRPALALFDEGITNAHPDESCQQEKPTLIEAGDLGLVANILPFHIMRIGQVLILGVPGEMTTMAGRRLRSHVSEHFTGPVIISGLSNEYSHYIATRQEYAAQHYEGASTLYGPWTQAAHQQIFSHMTQALQKGEAVPAGPTPRDLSHLALDISPGVVFDLAPWGKRFGDMADDARTSYAISDKITVVFYGAHPNNDLKTDDSYLSVEKMTEHGFLKIYFDWDPSTKLHWERDGIAGSLITIEWQTTSQDSRGIYRICHSGAAKSFFFGEVEPYHGCSRAFSLE